MASPLLAVLLCSPGGLSVGCGGGDSSTPGPDDTAAGGDVVGEAEIGGGDATDASEVADATDAADVTEAGDAGDSGDAGGLVCGSTTCKSTEWCVVPCCGGADTGTPCTPPPPYCTPGGCSGSGCDSLCFGRSSAADPGKRQVRCLCA